MTTVVLLDLAAALWAVIFRYVPGSTSWWNTKATPIVKRLIMGGLVIASGFIVYGLACLGWMDAFNWSLACDADGMNQLIALVTAALVNQGTYNLIREKK